MMVTAYGLNGECWRWARWDGRVLSVMSREGCVTVAPGFAWLTAPGFERIPAALGLVQS